MINEKISDKSETSIAGLVFIIIGYFVLFNVIYNSFLFFYESMYLHKYVSLVGDNDFDFIPSLLKVVVTFILVLFIYIFNGSRWTHVFGFQAVSFKCLVLCVGCIFLYFSIYDFFHYLFDETYISKYFVDDRVLGSDTYKTFLAFLFVCLIIPACEEVFFRGYLMRYLLDSDFNKHFCVVFSSILFSALHYNYSPFFLVEVFIISCMIGYARVISKSVYPCIIMHGAYNAVFFMQF